MPWVLHMQCSTPDPKLFKGLTTCTSVGPRRTAHHRCLHTSGTRSGISLPSSLSPVRASTQALIPRRAAPFLNWERNRRAICSRDHVTLIDHTTRSRHPDRPHDTNHARPVSLALFLFFLPPSFPPSLSLARSLLPLSASLSLTHRQRRRRPRACQQCR